MKSKGLNVIAVNFSDSAQAVRDFRKEFNLSMPIALGGNGEDSIAMKFGVMAFPTNYVLDSEGKVVAQFVGYDEKSLLESLKKLGIK